MFQSYALFPWLTVLGNVELGLEALGVSNAERRRRAVDAIDVIGLDGFETAYPKELSGGMRQRVGLARALVVQPSILLRRELPIFGICFGNQVLGQAPVASQQPSRPPKCLLARLDELREVVPVGVQRASSGFRHPSGDRTT